MLNINMLVSDVKIPLSLSNWLFSQFSEESVKVLSNQTSNAYTRTALLCREGNGKSPPELASEKGRIETLTMPQS